MKQEKQKSECCLIWAIFLFMGILVICATIVTVQKVTMKVDCNIQFKENFNASDVFEGLNSADCSFLMSGTPTYIVNSLSKWDTRG